MSDALTNCPKCGFSQPVDQYCANCGVDMLTLQKKSAASFASLAKKPGFIAGVALVTIAITLGTAKMMRHAPVDEIGRSSSFASQSSPRTRKENLRADATPEMRRALDARVNETAPIRETAKVEPAAIDADAPGESATPSKSMALSSKPTKAASQTDDGLLVAFAWTEVSRDWLHAMGATEPGIHRVPDLEERLRASTGSYRILEVSKQKITSETTSFTLQSGDHGGNRTGLKVDISSLNESGLAGSIQLSYRGNDGSMRAPAAAAMALEKGQGSIMTFAPTAPPPGVSPTGGEIVVLILPRWGADRNP